MRKLAGIIVFIGLLLVAACGGSEVPTEMGREDETEIQGQSQVDLTAQVIDALKLPTASSLFSVEDPEKDPEGNVIELPEIEHGLIYYGTPPSLDMQIFEADIIVVATLVSATAGIQADGDLFLPVQELRFRSSEYLKGSGPAEFIVKVPITEYELTARTEALENATTSIAFRNSDYDSRSGVLFLKGPLASADASSGSVTRSADGTAISPKTTTTTYGFIQRYLNISSWEYSIDTDDKVWAPARSSASSPNSQTRSVGSSTSSDTEYIVDGKTNPPDTMTLSALKKRISEIAAEISAGGDTPSYEECIGGKYERENFFADREPLVRPFTIPSGAAPATQVLDGWEVRLGDSVYRNFFEEGKDANYFGTTIIDDDEDPGSYSFVAGPNRPLPAGLYKVVFNSQWPHQIPCDYRKEPVYSDEVTAVPPGGTLHEAFFDPVTVGTGVKADGSNGVLKPTSFTVGGTSTELTSLEWSSNHVVLTLNPHVSLGNHVLSFIELDGSVSLSLSAADATVDSSAGTYSWPVTTEPWEDGDQLMLRIRE